MQIGYFVNLFRKQDFFADFSILGYFIVFVHFTMINLQNLSHRITFLKFFIVVASSRNSPQHLCCNLHIIRIIDEVVISSLCTFRCTIFILYFFGYTLIRDVIYIENMHGPGDSIFVNDFAFRQL
jgi:hypothetical protein